MAAQLLPVRGSRSRKRLVRQLLPYCVVETPEGYLLLNRNYKPLGWPIEGQSRVDYTDYQFASLRVTPVVYDPPGYIFDKVEGPVACEAVGMTRIANDDGVFWFFYGGDVPAPWRSDFAANEYKRRLSMFLGCEISKEGGL
jgi:hypothetical protein